MTYQNNIGSPYGTARHIRSISGEVRPVRPHRVVLFLFKHTTITNNLEIDDLKHYGANIISVTDTLTSRALAVLP